MKKINVNIKWVVSFIITFIGFIFIERVMTFQPHITSGNGNPGIVVMFIIFPFFIFSLYLTYKQFSRLFLRINIWMINIIVLLLCMKSIGLLITPLLDFAYELVQALGGPPTEVDSRIYNFGWFNQYTNSIYFNIYTFTIAHLLAVIAASMRSLFSREK